MLPSLSPEIMDYTSFLKQIEETDPWWPEIALVQVYFYQKYKEPLPIPEIIYYLVSPLYLHLSGCRHKVGEILKFTNCPLLEFKVPFSKVMNKISLSVANTKYF